MSNSSAQSVYSITSSDIISIGSLSTDTVTLSTGSSTNYYYTSTGLGGFSSDTITISNGGTINTSSGTVSIGTVSGAGTGFNWNVTEEFVDCLPDFNRVKAMCEEYPGLKIAYEKFVTTYKLVKDHYDTPEDQRPKP
jgi:hypothetical protein